MNTQPDHIVPKVGWRWTIEEDGRLLLTRLGPNQVFALYDPKFLYLYEALLIGPGTLPGEPCNIQLLPGGIIHAKRAMVSPDFQTSPKGWKLQDQGKEWKITNGETWVASFLNHGSIQAPKLHVSKRISLGKLARIELSEESEGRRLDVKSELGFVGLNLNGGYYGCWAIDAKENGNFEISESGRKIPAFLVDSFTGNIGIYETNPTQGVVVINRDAWHPRRRHAFMSTGRGGEKGATNRKLQPVSLYAVNRVVASEMDAISDARIKNIQSVSNSQEDLHTLSQIEITNFQYKDFLTYGNGQQKKVIGQQVAKVYPQSVHTHNKDVIPNILQSATLVDGTIHLANHGLQIGDLVRVVLADGTQKLVPVEDVTSYSFQVPLTGNGDVFVYGKEVHDVHHVNYESLTTLNISATQELLKMIQQQQIQIEALKLEMAVLKTKLH